MPGETANFEKLKNIAEANGAVLFGAAEINAFKDKFHLEPAKIVEDLNYGISIGVPLSEKILDTCLDGPSKLYFYHYRQLNYLLDHICLKITAAIQQAGHQALPIPSSQVVDWEKQTGHLSHRVVAENAGLGWRGKNNLVINPDFGPRLRYATVLTDMPLRTGKPLAGECGECRQCVEICPAGAIGERTKDFDLKACLNQLKKFSRERNIGHYICGLCIKACPVGKNENGTGKQTGTG